MWDESRRSNMTPLPTFSDVRDRCRRDAVLPRDLNVRKFGSDLELDVVGNLVGEFRKVGSGAPHGDSPSLPVSIAGVFARCSIKQVIRVAARRVVALMAGKAMKFKT